MAQCTYRATASSVCPHENRRLARVHEHEHAPNDSQFPPRPGNAAHSARNQKRSNLPWFQSRTTS